MRILSGICLLGILGVYGQPFASAQNEYEIRLMITDSVTTANEGRVEIFYNGQWGTICGLSFYSSEASVVCRQLGFLGQSTYYRSSIQYGEGSGPVWLRVSNCNGDEQSIHECKNPSYDWGDTSCSTSYSHVGVKCSFTPLSLHETVRLAGQGSTASRGRVEINYYGRWGTVCRNYWDSDNANTVCKQLGFSRSSQNSFALNGTASGIIWLDNVRCNSNDEVLASCSHSSWGSHNCDHSDDIAVACSVTNDLDDNTLRLVAGSSVWSDEGRLEIYYNGQWGTVCDNYFSGTVAIRACRQLGFSSAITYRTSAYYGGGSGAVWFQLSTYCSIGYDDSLANCPHYDPASTTCSHQEDVGVVCSRYSSIHQYSIRLAGRGASSSQGRVEINYAGRWGTVCGDLWGNINAGVVCKQLGFTGPSTANVGQYGSGSGTIWLDDVRCDVSDDTLASCSHSSWGTNNCDHSQDAGVICSSTNETDEMSLRLVGSGSSFLAGRVELFHAGHWGTICGLSFDKNDADVVCRQLGFDGAVSYETDSFYGAGSGEVLLHNPECIGNEERLNQCNLPGFGTVSTSCDHGNDVSVRCSTDPGMLREFAVRLVGSSNSEGRIEINYNGQWGTICDAGWGLDDASVACRQLGFSGAARATSGAHFGKGTGAIWMKDVACSGDEIYLASCNNGGWGNTGECTHRNDAGVACKTEREHDDYILRLSGAGSLSHAGRVEIYYKNQWGTVCDNSWDLDDATVACRRLGFADATDAPRGSFYGHGSGPIWIDEVDCSGTETSLEMCGHIGFGNTGCDHAHDASVICSTDRNEQDFTVRLAGTESSASEGRVEISYNGQWGTVCSDRWGLDDATVVCKQLGFTGAMDVGDATTYGEGTGPIWLNNVGCSGTEATLNDCGHDGWGTSDCEHSHDAGVVCSTSAHVAPLSAGGIAGISVAIGVLVFVVILLLIVNIKQRQAIIKTTEEKPMEITLPAKRAVAEDNEAYENLAI